METQGCEWTAEEALAIALDACLYVTDFEHGRHVAVTRSGDSDTTGAIAGNRLGRSCFPIRCSVTHGQRK